MVTAVLGKGGAGKTAFCALAARSLIDLGAGPLLLVDADPTGGLAWAVGAGMEHTVGAIRERLIREAAGPDSDRATLAGQIDWMALEALQERQGYSLLAMGRSEDRGCYCPLNSLLREAIGKLAEGFAHVVLDAEAGIEQVNRQVFRRVDLPVVVTDGSVRGMQVVRQLSVLLERYGLAGRIGLVLNRAERLVQKPPAGVSYWGRVPDDDMVRACDQAGSSLLGLPHDAPALCAVRAMIEAHLAGGGA